MRERIVLVGEDFGNSAERFHHDMYALTGASGRRLIALSGMARIAFFFAADRTNVVELPEHWTDKALVRAGVERIKEKMHGHRTILLGAKVAAAFDVTHHELYEWHVVWDDCRVARMPHPSGRSHYWNDPANVELARQFLTRTVK